MTYLIGRLMTSAKDASQELKNDRADLFAQGRNLAYYEMLDMIKSGLDMYDISPQDYGIEEPIEKLL